MFADIQAAINVERRMGKSKASVRDLLNKVCAEYNRLTTIKKHRIDGNRKALLLNLCLSMVLLLQAFLLFLAFSSAACPSR